MTDETLPTLRCANHPARETMLRCNKCDKPICVQCAVRTPVGYRCKECVAGQQAIFYNGNPSDSLIAGAVALVLGAIAGALAYAFLGFFGWFSFIAAIFVGPVVGGLIAEAARRAVRKRRSRQMKWIVASACVIGILAGGLLVTVGPALGWGGAVADFTWIIPTVFLRWDVLLFAALAASTIYTRHL